MGRQNREGGGAEPVPPPASVHDTLLRAAIDVVSTVGYEATVVDEIVQVSGLSRTVLYRRLGGKQGAVLAAARQTLDDLTFAVETARTDDDAQATADGAVEALTALTAALAADPPAAAVLFLEVPAAGRDARALRADLLALITAILGGPPGLPAWSPAGAVLDLLHRRIARGQTVELPSLAPQIMQSLSLWSPEQRGH